MPASPRSTSPPRTASSTSSTRSCCRSDQRAPRARLTSPRGTALPVGGTVHPPPSPRKDRMDALITPTAPIAGVSAVTTTVATARPVAPERARSLARWNRVLSGLHGIQFVAMLAVASTAAAFAPYLSTVKVQLVDGKFAGLEAVKVELFSMPLAWFIASFLAMSAIAHFLAGWPLRARYEAWL